MKFIPFTTIAATVITAATIAPVSRGGNPTFYIIRHAEKDSDGDISAKGKEREKCLIKVFGRDSNYDIQYIMAPKRHEGEPVTQRPYNTTLPLAESLNLTIDTPCNYNDPECEGEAARRYAGRGNVLIAWEHDHIPAVVEAIGGENVPSYPGSKFNLIYNQPPSYTKVTITSENCPGLDN